MSSRLGNFLRAVDVLDMVSKEVSDEKIALAAVKYAMLKYKVGGDFDFDVKSSVSMTGNSGVYLLYSTVRARKILLACSSSSSDALLTSLRSRVPRGERRTLSTPRSATPDSLNKYEHNLCRKLTMYPNIIKEATAEMAPHKICTYLYELAQEFSRFYENVQVAGSDSESARSAMVKAYYNVMTHGLNLLGIEVPEEM